MLFFNKHADHHLLGYIFFSTIAAYNAYWLLSKYQNGGRVLSAHFLKRNSLYILLSTFGGLVSLAFIMRSGVKLWLLIPAVAGTLLYFMVLLQPKMRIKYRELGFLKTILLALTWTYTTVILPVNTGVDIPATGLQVMLFINRFMLMFILCAIFDTKHIEADKEIDVYTIATGISGRYYLTIISIVFMLFFVAGFWVKFATQGRAGAMAFLLMFGLVWWVYRLSRRPRGYYFYYFIVDGLMLLPLLTYFLAGI